MRQNTLELITIMLYVVLPFSQGIVFLPDLELSSKEI